MPEFIQPEKPKLDREKDSGMYDDAREQADQAAQAARDRAASVSQNAGNTVNDIDDLLNEQDADSPTESLRNQEEGNDESSEDSQSEASDEEAGLYRDEDEASTGKTTLSGRLASNKKWLLIGGGGGGLILLVLLVFLLLFSSLKLPNLSENITSFAFARVSRSYAKAAGVVTDEVLAKQAVAAAKDTKTAQAIKNLRDEATGLKDGAIDKVKGVPGVSNAISLNNKYNPSKVSANLHADGFKEVLDGKGNLKGFSISGDLANRLGIADQTILVKQITGPGRYIPGFRQYLKFSAKVDALNEVQPALQDSIKNGLRVNDDATLYRGYIMNLILKRIGINRLGFPIKKFASDDDPKKGFIEAQQEAEKAIAPKEGHIPGGGVTEDASNSAVEEQTSAETSSTTGTVDGGDTTGIPAEAAAKVGTSVTESALNKFTSVVGGVTYQFAFLACIFDEAIDANSNQQNIDAGSDANQRSFVLMSSISDEQKRGVTSNDQVGGFDNGIAAFNEKAGDDTEDSIPLQRASGNSFDTSGELATQQNSPLGFQPPEQAVGGGLIWTLMGAVQGKACDLITNQYVGAAGALASIATYFAGEGEGAKALDEAGNEATQSATKSFTQKILDGIVKKSSENFGPKAGVKVALKNVVTKPAKLFAKLGTTVGIVGLTEFAGALVGAMHSPGVTHSGASTGNTWINEADAGGNATGNEQCQKMQFCRPLTKSEVCDSNADDDTYLTDNFEAQNSFQRYLATSDSQSLLSRTVMTVGSEFSGPVSKPLVGLSSMLAKPATLFGSLLTIFSGKAHAMQAATNCDSDTADYGNVQFGWSRAEEALIDSDPSYKPDENLAILASSGQAEKIASTYAKCFGFKVGDDDSLEVDPSASLGNLLSGDSPDIVRDEHGNVVADQGDCSPDNLSYKNTTDSFAQDNDPDSPQRNDMVFRWRLANRYNNTTSQLVSIQDADSAQANSPGSAGDGSGAGDVANINGSAQTLAQQIINNTNITKSPDALKDLNAIVAGKQLTACSPAVSVDPALLKLALGIAQTYQYQINDIETGHPCDGKYHTKGKALDIFYLDGQSLTKVWADDPAKAIKFSQDIAAIMHAQDSTNFFGLGVDSSKVLQVAGVTSGRSDYQRMLGNVEVFADSTPGDEVHIDTGIHH